MPDAHLHFPKADTAEYRKSWDAGVRCAVMQGGQGEVKHWAFNDPLPRKGRHKDCAATRRGISQADHACRRPASADHRAERPHQRRRKRRRRADQGHHGRTGRDVEGRQGLHLARRPPRQSIRATADGADDFEADRRHIGPDVAARRSSERAVQLLSRGHRDL